MPRPRVGHPCIVGSFRGDVVTKTRTSAGRRDAGVVSRLTVMCAAMLVATGCSGSGPAAAPTAIPSASTATQSRPVSSSAPVIPIRYLVAPHPDDEFAMWSMAQDPRHFPVLLVLTHGEKAAACGGAGLQAATGERIPSPPPSAPPSTTTCSAERIDSLLAFLRDVGSLDPRWSSLTELPPRTGVAPANQPLPQRCDTPTSCTPALGYREWRAAGAALLVFDLGDHDVTPAEVTWAIATARSQRTTFTPTGTEDDIVGMGYENTTDPSFAPYDHPDQQAVAQVMTTVNLGLPGPQWSRTYPADPARAMTATIDPAFFAAITAVSPGPVDPVANPDARRVGALQVDYGWLAFPGAYWYAEQEPVHSFYSRSQDFTKSF